MEPRTEAGKRLAETLSTVPHRQWRPERATFEADILAIEEEARTVNPEGRSTDEDGLRAAIRAAFDATSVNADGIDWGCAGDLDGLATRLASALTTSSPGDELGAARNAVAHSLAHVGIVDDDRDEQYTLDWTTTDGLIRELDKRGWRLARSTPSSSPRTPTDGAEG